MICPPQTSALLRFPSRRIHNRYDDELIMKVVEQQPCTGRLRCIALKVHSLPVAGNTSAWCPGEKMATCCWLTIRSYGVRVKYVVGCIGLISILIHTLMLRLCVFNVHRVLLPGVPWRHGTVQYSLLLYAITQKEDVQVRPVQTISEG